MNEYIIYTTEGQTKAPNDNYEVENCQVLGRVLGLNTDEALSNLFRENEWIVDAGFKPEKFLIKQVLTDEQHNDIKSLLDYLWEDKKQHFKEDVGNSCNIFNIINRLKNL